MTNNDKRIEVEFGATTSELAAKSREAIGQVTTFAGAVQAAAIQGGGAWSGLASAFETQGGRIGQALGNVTRGLIGLGGILSAGLFANMVKDQIDAAASLHDVAQQTGFTVEALSGLASIGKLSETSVESIAAASNRMAASLAKTDEEGAGAAAALRALGIDFKAFQAMSPDERMLAVAKAMAECDDSTEKTAAAMALMGRQGAQLLPFMADLADAGEIQAKITAEQAEAADAFGDNLVRLRANGEAWKKTLSLSMAPALRDASQAFLDVFKQAGGLKDQIQALANDGSIDRWTRNAVTGFTYLIDTVIVLKRAFVTIGEAIGAGVAQASTMLGGVVDAYNMITAGNLTGAVDALKGAYGQMRTIGQEFLNDQEAAWGQSTLGGRIRDAMDKAAAGGGDSKGSRRKLDFKNAKVDDDKDDKAKAEKSSMPLYEEQLEQARYVATQLDAIHGMQKADEVAFWQNIQATQKLTEKDQISVAKKIAAARIEVLKDEASKRGELDRMSIDSARNRALAEVDVAEEASRLLLATGQISESAALAQQRDFEEQRNAIRIAALQMQAQQLDPALDVVKLAQIHEQIQQQEQQHQMKLAQIRTQMATQSAKDQGAIWASLGSTLSGLWDKGINAMMNGTLTWKGAFRAVMTDVVGWFASSVIKPMVMKWIFGQEAMTAATMGAKMEQLAIESWAALKSVALWLWTAGKNIMISAWQAMANAWAAISAIPVVGPVLAPVAAGVAFAGVSAIVGHLASASGGYDIPAGVNPLTQLHQKEMVLPAKHADVIRSLADGGTPAAKSAGTVINIPATGGDFVRVKDLAAALKRADRNFEVRRS